MDFKNKKIVAIIAHPDDETIGCGGLLSKASALGAECKVILPLKRANQRIQSNWEDEINNFKKACTQLGAIPILTEELVNDDIAIHQIQKIATIVSQYISWADLILCHWNGDLHHAHKAISSAIEISTRPFRNDKTVLCFEIATSTDQGFENTFSPNCFVSLNESDVLNKKNAMQNYQAEFVSGRTPNDLEIQMRMRGIQSGTEYAEAYRIARYFIK